MCSQNAFPYGVPNMRFQNTFPIAFLSCVSELCYHGQVGGMEVVGEVEVIDWKPLASKCVEVIPS